MNTLRPRPITLPFLYPSPSSTTLSHPPHTFPPIHSHNHNHNQIRHATLIRRPLRPYTFTQLVTLSDGSTYTHRTTSPAPLYKSRKDTRNTPMWNPSSQKLLNVEADEAGKLRRFREKFGRGWDATASATASGSGTGQGGSGEMEVDGGSDGGSVDGGEEGGGGGGVASEREGEEVDNLMDLISGYGREAEREGTAAGVRESKVRSGKGKGGEK